ncbi:3-hydroxyisobutyryl-CoA hydrolase 1-like isoform X3 [Primulina eburnea]|uniref:3-hydroxyisobutyryl-CoA hydrolase 1-like isoform X3 n=1 Tax=Primulina eburnea TaxID=1245227 RepID=UPI003C6CBF9E
MLVPEARGTSLGFLLVCWQMLAFIFFYGTRESICAGVDVAVVVRDITLGNWRSGASYFRKEFTLNYVMATYYSKPQLFAVPETALGLFPDVGSSYYLSRSPGFFVVLRPGMRYVHQLAIRIMLLKPVKQETNFIEMNLDKTWMVEAW